MYTNCFLTNYKPAWQTTDGSVYTAVNIAAEPSVKVALTVDLGE